MSLGQSNTSIHEIIWDVPDIKIPEEFNELKSEDYFKDSFNYDNELLKEKMEKLTFMVSKYKEIFKNNKISELRMSEITKILNPYEIEDTEHKLKKNYETLKTLFNRKEEFVKKSSSLNNLTDINKDKIAKIFAKAKTKLKNDTTGKHSSIDEITLALAIHLKLSAAFKELAKEDKKYADLKDKLESEQEELKNNFIIENKIFRPSLNAFTFFFPAILDLSNDLLVQIL